jgi:Domain of unknown function (DUF4326)
MTILNAKIVGKRANPDRVYVGRPSKWGNPFVIGRDGSRDEVIEKYRAWIVRQPKLMAALPELRGKDLVCWCGLGSLMAPVRFGPRGSRGCSGQPGGFYAIVPPHATDPENDE